jgi:hypothetical protein
VPRNKQLRAAAHRTLDEVLDFAEKSNGSGEYGVKVFTNGGIIVKAQSTAQAAVRVENGEERQAAAG